MGCDGLTPWSAGGGSMVPAPLVAVPSAAAWPRSPGRGRILRWVGSSSKSLYKGHPGRPPISFALPSPAPATDWTSLSTAAVAGAADSEEDTTMEEACRITSSVGIRPAPEDNNNTKQSVLSRMNGVVDPIRCRQHCPCPPPPTAAAATTRVSNALHLNGNNAAHAGPY